MKDLRIGQFTDSFPPIINGVSMMVIEHHAELLAQGQGAHVFTIGPARGEIDPPGVWRTPGVRLGTSQFYASPWLNAAASRAARSLEVIHAHDSAAIGLLAARLARRTGHPLVFTNHTRHDYYIRNYPRLLQPFLRRYTIGTVRHLIRTSALTTTPSIDSARWLKSVAPEWADRIHVIRNGVRLERFDRIDGRIARNEFGIGRDETLFIYVGRLSPEKNLGAFAEAFVRAAADGARAHWLVIGDGPVREELEAAAAPAGSRARFLGALPNARVPAYLAMADVFATSSMSETNPMSVLEAMACGLPYLGVEAGWWADFTTDDGSSPAGLLAHADPLDLARAIRQLCDDGGLRSRLGAQAMRLSRRFDARTVSAQWIDRYRTLAALQETRRYQKGAPAFR